MRSGTRRDVLTLALATVLVATAAIGVVVKDGSSRTSIRSSATDDDLVPPGTVNRQRDSTTLRDEDPATVGAGSRTEGTRSGASSDATSAGPGGSSAERSPVRVGFHIGDNDSAAATFGVGGLPNIGSNEIDAIVRQVNATGGLGGHPITPVYHRTDPLNGSFDTQGQRACEALIEDGNVRLLIDNALTPSKVLMECSARKHVPLVWELHMVQITNAEAARLAGLLYRPSMPNAERLDVIVDGLHGAGFFAQAKVGLIRYDAPESELISEEVFRPALKRKRVPVVSEYAVARPNVSTGAARMSGEASNAVLQFKRDGVTHVLFVPSGGAIPLVFLPAAASQGWYPKYGLSTQDAPDFVAENFAGPQLEGSMAVGWAPNIDGDRTVMTGPAVARCREAMRSAGYAWDPNVASYCSAIYFLQHALRGGGDVSPKGLRAAVEAVGTSFRSPYVFGTRLGPGRHDAPAQARALVYRPSTGRFVYSGGLLSF